MLLLLGAIVNVAVAWGCCLYGYRDAGSTANSQRDPTFEDMALWRSFDPPTGVQAPMYVWPTRVAGYCETRYVGHGPIFTPTANSGGAIGARAPQPYEITSSANWNEAGWPLRSMCGIWFGVPDVSTGRWTNPTRGAWKIDSRLVGQAFPRRAGYLPLRPKWPAFAINTTLYAAIILLLFAAPFALRRQRRIKRGLRPKCAYDLRNRPSESSACPECGSPRLPLP